VLQLCVECQKTDGEAFPVRFGWPQAMREVLEVDDWWPGDDHCYFRVRASDGNVYILRHNEPADSWELIFFESPQPHDLTPGGGARPLVVQ
jgi:hypothetical protein